MQSGSQLFLDIKLIKQAGDDSFEADKAKYNQTGQLPRVRFQMSRFRRRHGRQRHCQRGGSKLADAGNEQGLGPSGLN